MYVLGLPKIYIFHDTYIFYTMYYIFILFFVDGNEPVCYSLEINNYYFMTTTFIYLCISFFFAFGDQTSGVLGCEAQDFLQELKKSVLLFNKAMLLVY